MDQIDPLAELCPTCWAVPGKPCRTFHGSHDREPHVARVDAAKERAALLPPAVTPTRPATTLF